MAEPQGMPCVRCGATNQPVFEMSMGILCLSLNCVMRDPEALREARAGEAEAYEQATGQRRSEDVN